MSFGDAHIKKQGCVVHPDEQDIDPRSERYAEQLALYENAMAAKLLDADRKRTASQMIMHGQTFQPVEYKVLVKPDKIEETDPVVKRCNDLGIELPESEKAREKMKQITGTLIAVGGKAFEDFGDPSPVIGQKVYFAKYAGLVLKDDNEQEFRLMSDKDITGVLI